MADSSPRASTSEEENEKLLPTDLPVMSTRLKKTSHLGSAFLYISIVFAVLLGFLVGFGVARYRPARMVDFDMLNAVPRVPLSYSARTFVHDERFAALPPKNGEAEKVWDSLLPKGLGYVKHPKFAPEDSTVSVFHQLHCLVIYSPPHILFQFEQWDTRIL
ncbi:hypothetical protein BDV95DRAFT_566708 [Massariosphaeria phaeospora]|uniref:Uncharacterized protein n=1 Tax=Massariosphaeria phaeospora TaxID=100035 RepID=A0A7C8I8H0_9PLEO|nr:hypothetical protein BDV95DRAFT_566708 [Massariosphaeria phaeospora]